ncbi:MAG: hypothetical protein U0992_13770 [Planctomycetaceae bacterium]
MLKQDPKTQGPLLFARHCAACRAHLDSQGRGIAAKEASAPNLYGFGAVWIEQLLDPDGIVDPHVFGVSDRLRNGDMTGAIQKLFEDAGDEGAAAAA